MIHCWPLFNGQMLDTKLLNFKASFKIVAIWIRLPCLFVDNYDPMVLKGIASMIGLELRIDANIVAELEGTLFCVQLDLDRPLPRKLTLDKPRQCIQCEGFSSFCQFCRKICQQVGSCTCKLDYIT